MQYDVFISYSRKDTKVADKICEAFANAGISFFIDRKAIHGGNEFPKVIAEAIMESRIFLFLASENAYSSKFTSNEITFAFNKKPKETIVPYIIDKSELPIDLDFVFSSINRRYMDEHPIEPLLVNDILQLLNREAISSKVDDRKSIPWKRWGGFVLKYLFVVISVIGILLSSFVGQTSLFHSLFGSYAMSSCICFVLSIVGYTSPKVIFCKNRKEVTWFYLVPMFVLFFLCGSTLE